MWKQIGDTHSLAMRGAKKLEGASRVTVSGSDRQPSDVPEKEIP